MSARFVLLFSVLAGCSATPASSPEATRSVATAGSETSAPIAEAGPAPWSAEPLESAPSALMTAWRHADNHETCAPLAFRDVEGARARRSSLEGGWAVEFDQAGLPGMERNGHACASCGRSAFGIAGTGMTVDEEDPNAGDAERLQWADGSHAMLEIAPPSDDDAEPAVHVATVEVKGQSCVYQVWTMGSPEHLEELLGKLRLVAN